MVVELCGSDVLEVVPNVNIICSEAVGVWKHSRMAVARNFSKHILSHDIFRTEDEDAEAVKQFGGLQTEGVPRNQMCTRGNDLFLAVGNTVRCIDASADSTSGYKRLDLPNVDFLIHSLCINESGTLLAIVGEKKVVTCLLPPAGALSGKETCLRVRSRQVGTDDSHNVLKVVWNPIARYDSNLIVLTDDNYLRAYNLSWSYEDPEYVYCLTAQADEHGEEAFGVDYDELDDPVSFTLGSAAEPHGKFTLYVLTRSGDIFGLCPWVPSHFTMSKEEVEDMFDASVSLEYEYRQKADSKANVRRHYKQQLAWASQIWKQLATSMVESKLSPDGTLHDYHILRRPDRPPQDAQGPFSYHPFPQTLYEGDALDITAVDAGAMTALAVSYSTGRVTCFLQDVSLDMKWKGSGINSDVSLATLESIQLPATDRTSGGTSSASKGPLHGGFTSTSTSTFGSFAGSASGNSGFGFNNASEKSTNTFADKNTDSAAGERAISLQVDPAQDLCLFALEDKQAYRIDLSSWAIPLTHAMECGDLKEVERAISNSVHADVQMLVADQDTSGLKGFALLEDMVGSQFSVTKTKLGIWVDHWADTETAEARNNTSALLDPKQPLALTNSETSDSNKDLAYEPMFNKQSVEAELKSLLDGVEFVPPRPSASANLSLAEKIPPTMEGLEYFDTLTNFFYHELSKVEKAGIIMHKRLQAQRSELHRQLDELGKLSKQLKTVNENHVPHKLQDALDRQASLQKRSCDVLEKLTKSRALLLSEQEKKWFSELKRLQQRIYAGGGFEKRTKNAIAQADVILREFKLLDSDSASKSTSQKGVDADSVVKLQSLLAREGEVVESTKNTLQKLLEDNLTDEVKSLSI